MPDLIPDPPAGACANCAAPMTDAWCPACGQRRIASRLTVRDVLHELRDKVLDLESGLLVTLWTAMVRPGLVVTDWLHGRRRRYTPPLRFTIVVVGVLVAANALLLDAAPMDERTRTSLARMQSGLGSLGAAGADLQATMARVQWAFIALWLPLLALGTWLCFRAWRRTFAEHLAGAAYVYAAWGAISLALMTFEAGIGTRTFVLPNPVTTAMALVWIPWAVAETFPGAEREERIGRAIGACAIATAVMSVLMCVVGMGVMIVLLLRRMR